MNYFKTTYKTPIAAKTDLEIIQMYKESGDTNLVGELYTRYHHLVFGVALKYLQDAEKAEDALLNVFNHLFEQLLKYKIEEFKSWLLTVTRNHCLKEIKADARVIPFEPVHENLFASDFMENEMVLDHMHDKEKQIDMLEFALKKLKPEQNQCIRMFYLEDKSYQDIAEHTGYALKKVKSYIQNGKRNLQIIMEQTQKK